MAATNWSVERGTDGKVRLKLHTAREVETPDGVVVEHEGFCTMTFDEKDPTGVRLMKNAEKLEMFVLEALADKVHAARAQRGANTVAVGPQKPIDLRVN